MQLAFTVFNMAFLVLFLLSAAVQYNDPDPLQWLVIYFLAALLCALKLMHRQANWLAPILFLVSLFWAVSLVPSIFGQVSLDEVLRSLSMQTREVEEAREVGGLLLVALWAAIVWVYGRQIQA